MDPSVVPKTRCHEGRTHARLRGPGRPRSRGRLVMSIVLQWLVEGRNLAGVIGVIDALYYSFCSVCLRKGHCAALPSRSDPP